MKRKHEQGQAADEDQSFDDSEGVGSESLQQDLGERSEIERLTAESAEYLANWQRAQADYKNLRRRAAEDVHMAVRHKLEPLLSDLLLVLDHFDMALASPTESDDAKAMRFGVELVRKQVVTLLENSDVEPIATEGAFDPNLHQAISRLEDDNLDHEVIQTTVRKGYLWHGRPLRFAQVVVACPKSQPPPASSEMDAS